MAKGVRTGKKPEEPKRGTPAYMLTYGDLTTLMLIFFVFLFRVGEISESKYQAAIASFRQALGVFPRSISVLRPDEVVLVPRERGTKQFWGVEKRMNELQKQIQQQLEEYVEKGNILQIKAGDKGEIYVTLGSQALFDSGMADLKPEFHTALDAVSKIVKDNYLQVHVEGHTDNVPISTARFPSNWELSSARAISVVNYMKEKHGVPPPYLSAIGYGEYRPKDSNETPEGRQSNRRIEIRLSATEKTPTSIEKIKRDLFGGTGL
ncbi:MAG: OmpA family protein [bacterium]